VWGERREDVCPICEQPTLHGLCVSDDVIVRRPPWWTRLWRRVRSR